MNAPENWLPLFQQDIHALAILAADPPEDLDRLHKQLTRHTHAHKVVELGQGHVRPGDHHSHEHFGFRDGMSQPGVIGLTEEPKLGQEMIPAGEFIFGYPAQAEEAPPAPPPNAYQLVLAPPPQRFPGWAVNGSLLWHGGSSPRAASTSSHPRSTPSNNSRVKAETVLHPVMSATRTFVDSRIQLSS